MLIKKIKIENIRSYESQEIEFPKGSVLLSGDIGCGKTSVLLAIEFALFGLQPSQRGSSLLRNGAKEGRVVLEFEIDGKTIIIERVLKRGSKTITQDYSCITINNEKFEASVTEIKNKILDLLSYPQEFAKKTNLLYKFTVYTPQEEMKQIITESIDTRLNTLRHVFGIDKYKRIEENIDIFKSNLREKIRNKEGQISDIEQIKMNLEEKKQRLSSLKNNSEQEKKIFEEQKLAREKIELESKELENKIKEKENFEREKDKAALVFVNKKDSLSELKNQIQRLSSEIEEGRKISFNQNQFLEIETAIKSGKEQERVFQEKIINLSSQINSLEKTKQEASQLKDKISRLEKCPTCLQEVNESYKQNIFSRVESELSSASGQILKLNEQKTQAQSSLESLRKQTESLNLKKSELQVLKIKLENLKEKENSLKEIETRIQKINSDIEMMSQHIKTLEASISDFAKFDSLYKEKAKQLEQAKFEERRQEIKVAEISKEISLVSENIVEIEKQIQEKEILKKRIEYLKELENWLVEKFLNLILFTEKNVMTKLKDEFSKLFTEWFSILVPEALSARLSDDFTPLIEQQGYELLYSYLSGGERTAVALAYRLSLNQVINSLLSKIKTRDLVILDEPTDGFSEQQLDKMRDVLSQLSVTQLILVSHEAKIESFVENIIKFKKEGGVTKIEM